MPPFNVESSAAVTELCHQWAAGSTTLQMQTDETVRVISSIYHSFQMHHFLIARLNTRTPKAGVLLHNAFLCFASRTLSASNTIHHGKGGSFTVSNLINSCCLSPDVALKLSKRLQSKNQTGPNAVVDLLRNCGFSDTQLSVLVKKHPLVLLANPEKTLLPKLKFLQSVGVSGTDLPRILIGNTSFLTTSLKNSTIPRYKIVRSLVRSDEELVKTLKHGTWHFHSPEVITDSASNIEVLRQLGLPQGSISLLVTNFPGVVFMKHSGFVEAVNTTKEMGFDPLKTNFVLALQVLAKMSKAMWKSKLEVFERWGWSRDMCLLAFKRYPQCMMLSEKKITKTLSFLVKDKGWPLEEIARCPGILNRNLERTFVPRCAVVEMLKSRGLVKNNLSLSSFVTISENKFLERYVTKFQESLPLLMDVYKGKKLD